MIDATYILEGNGPTALVTYDIIVDLFNHLKLYSQFEDYENAPRQLHNAIKSCRKSIRSEIPTDDKAKFPKKEIQDSLVARAKVMLQKPFQYFKKTIYDGDEVLKSKLANDMRLYRICRYFDPISFRGLMNETNYQEFEQLFEEIWHMRDEASNIKKSSIFTKEEMSQVKDEWSKYRFAVRTINATDNDYNSKYRMSVAMQFWRNSTSHNIPTIAKFARYCFCIVASSAAAERVFSTLKNGLSLVQLNKCIEDYSEIAIMLQYNRAEACSDVTWENTPNVINVDMEDN